MRTLTLIPCLVTLLLVSVHCDDKVLKEKVDCVIETMLSSERCKETARQHANITPDRQSGCNTIRTFRDVLSHFGCEQSDYDKLHSVVCENKDLKCTMNATEKNIREARSITLSTEGQGEQSEGPTKEQMLCIIETRLTEGRCRDTARERAENGHDPKTACSTLRTFEKSLSVVGCTDRDYAVLEEVVCDHQNLECSLFESGSNEITSRGLNGGNEIESEGPTKEQMLCIIETRLTEGRCRDTARERAENGHDPKTACSTLRTFEKSLSVVGCTDRDYAVLEEVVCDHKNLECSLFSTYEKDQTEMPTNKVARAAEVPAKQVSKEKVLCVIETLTPGLCRNTARERAENNHDPENGCQTLLTMKYGLSAVNCSDEDYEKMKAVVCDGKDVPCTRANPDDKTTTTGTTTPVAPTVEDPANKVSKENVMCAIETLTPGRCRETARERAQHNHDPRIACTTVMSFQPSLSTVNCTERDFNTIKAAVCDGVDMCGKSNSGRHNVTLRSILRSSSSQQPGYDSQRPGNGGQQPGNGGQRPGNGGQRPGNGGQRPGNGGQRPGIGSQRPGNASTKEKILCIIETLSSERCKSSARQHAQSGSNPESACKTLESFKNDLAVVGCNTEDYRKLHAVVCERRDVPCRISGRTSS
ncbi:hypothetical protein BgiMline_032410 [Biomphalaria glabrata]|nr:hypothetical protein BgiMline_015427 [Biomphalaria glabrata]